MKKINKAKAFKYARDNFNELQPKEPAMMCADTSVVVIALHDSDQSLVIRNDDLWRVMGMIQAALTERP